MSTKREPEITKSIEVESKQVETISYLGPQGTFCESALMTQSDLSTYKSFPQKNIVDVFNKTSSGKTVNATGVIGCIFDKDALGVTNLDRRVTTNYNPKAEFYTNFYKFDAGFFNDLNENFVVFYIA